MGESTCLMQPFSYGIPDETQEGKGNPLQALGQSVSFGRFMLDSLDWDKWSTFSRNRYVEEAERYSRPGSVAQKKAFFEAHYKKLAAAKKAAAAALLQQENKADSVEQKSENMAAQDSRVMSFTDQYYAQNLNAQNVTKCVEELKFKFEEKVESEDKILVENSMRVNNSNNNNKKLGRTTKENRLRVESLNKLSDMFKKEEMKELHITQKAKPALKQNSMAMGNKKTPTKEEESNLPSTPAPKPTTSVLPLKKESLSTPVRKKPVNVIKCSDKRRSTPTSSYQKTDGLSNMRATKECSTPQQTPNMACSSTENRRRRIDIKSIRTDCSKFLSACKDKSYSPSLFRCYHSKTEERPTRREKLEEKFKAADAEKQQQQEKAETEVKKLRQSLCFKARPLPDFYKARATLREGSDGKCPLVSLEMEMPGDSKTLSLQILRMDKQLRTHG